MLEESQENLIFPELKLQDQKRTVSQSYSFNPETPPPSPISNNKRGRKSLKNSPVSLRKVKSESQCGINQNFGHWSLEQNKRYHWFLQIHNNHFLNKHMRRTDKIFKTMAIFVGSRQAQQCRSHHQKMEKKYNHSICLILLSLRRQHYESEHEALLEEDIRLNHVQVCDEILKSNFLIEEAARFYKQQLEANQEPQIHAQLCEEEEKKEEQQQQKQQAAAVKQVEEMNVDMLLSDYDYAPHILFQMI